MQCCLKNLYWKLAVLDITMYPWTNLSREQTDGESAKGIVGSFYMLCRTLGTIGVAITFLIAVMMFGATKDPNKRQQYKEQYLSKILIIIVLFAVPAIYGWVVTIMERIAG